MLVSDFDYQLPRELIAQQPPAERAGARMLTLDRHTGALADRRFLDLPSLLREGDVLVVNDSRVLPARLYAERAGLRPQPGQRPAQVQVLLTEQRSAWEWDALVRPGRKSHVGERLHFLDPLSERLLLAAEIVAHGPYGQRTLRFDPVPDFYAALETLGHMPLPPYMHRPDQPTDKDRYQTVYARDRGSIAAPTAGLHFTEEVLAAIRGRGVTIVPITLHVGLGTFQPVRVERLEDIVLHTERYTLPAATAAAINLAVAQGRRVLAAGTTTVRTLEHCARLGTTLTPHSGQTSIFLSPGSEFRIVTALLTNFHLPQSTLLMLVSAFAGYDRTMAAYRHAVQQQYRFFSYGDCMFIS
ncbi:MAG TPA: tRNA preQ1(34) S-adenosylmethionine ribosyltransferase-isomerase QueA [Acidobacteriaceae bacterium]